MDVIATILNVARRNAVNAVLCAGDLFDDPTPAADFWEGLVTTFRNRSGPHPPVFLVPGNHIRERVDLSRLENSVSVSKTKLNVSAPIQGIL